MRIMVTKARDDKWYKNCVGKVYKVEREGFLSRSYVVFDDGYKNLIRMDDCQLVLTKGEALKMAIDGHKVQPIGVAIENDRYLFFDKGRFSEKCGGFYSPQEKTLDLPNDIYWTIYSPQPKFSIGQFVVGEFGEYARVLDCKNIMDRFLYSLIISESGITNRYHRFDMFEDQLKEVEGLDG